MELQYNILTLPIEILSHIFSFLTHKDLAKSTEVCSHFKRIANDDALWKKLCIVKNWTLPKTLKSHKNLYLKRITSKTYCRICGARTTKLFPLMGNIPLCAECRTKDEYLVINKTESKTRYALTDADLANLNSHRRNFGWMSVIRYLKRDVEKTAIEKYGNSEELQKILDIKNEAKEKRQKQIEERSQELITCLENKGVQVIPSHIKYHSVGLSTLYEMYINGRGRIQIKNEVNDGLKSVSILSLSAEEVASIISKRCTEESFLPKLHNLNHDIHDDSDNSDSDDTGDLAVNNDESSDDENDNYKDEGEGDSGGDEMDAGEVRVVYEVIDITKIKKRKATDEDNVKENKKKRFCH